MNQVNKSPSNNKDPKSVDVTSLKVSQNFQCKGEDFYRAMTTPEVC